MSHHPSSPPAALRRALLLDAAASGPMGVLLLLAAGPLGRLLGLPAGLLRWAGVVLVPFALLLLWLAGRGGVGAARSVVAANVLWVIASLLLFASDSLRPTPLGTAFVLIQAAAVAALAYLEHAASRRGVAALAPSHPA